MVRLVNCRTQIGNICLLLLQFTDITDNEIKATLSDRESDNNIKYS